MRVVDEAVGQIEILLVEDNVADLLLMMKFLKESKVKSRVNITRDGETAVDYLRKTNGFESAIRPDLVLLDLGLPLMDGRAVLKMIKNDPQLKSIPVVILSGSDHPADVAAAYRADVNFYMIKPCDLFQFNSSMKYLEEVWLKVLARDKRERGGDWLV